jgi:peptide/nickel transport system substrate-binding protein
MVKAEKPGRKATLLKPLGEAEIAGKYTVRWRMPAPNLSALRGFTNLLVVPLARREMTAEEFEKKPIGTGPYKVVAWPRDGTVTLEAWDGYRLGKPSPSKLTVRYVQEPSTRVSELLAGNAQLVQRVPLESIPSIEANAKLEVVSLKGGSSLSYVINVFKTTPPLRDKRIRQAMNYAVDREAIVKSILGGRGTALPGPLWSGWMGYTEDVKPYPYDLEKAKALLKEAGHPDGFSFDWTITQGVYVKDIEVAQAVASQLARVGIKASLQPKERTRLLAERNEGAFDVIELVWPMSWDPTVVFTFTIGTPFPEDKLVPRWGATPSELAEARRLVKEAEAATDLDKMGAAYGRVNRVMHDEAFWLFVHTVDEVWGIQKDTGWRPWPATWPDLYWYDRWTLIGKKAPISPNVPLVF